MSGICTEFFKETIVYEEFDGVGDNQGNIYKAPVNIKGLEVKGDTKITHSADGDTTTSSLKYRTNQYIIPGSKLNGREVESCNEVNALFLKNPGYMCYIK